MTTFAHLKMTTFAHPNDNICPTPKINVTSDYIKVSEIRVSIKDPEPALKQRLEILEPKSIAHISDKSMKAIIEIKDAANFYTEFINKLYSIMTAETLTMWSLIKQPDSN